MGISLGTTLGLLIKGGQKKAKKQVLRNARQVMEDMNRWEVLLRKTSSFHETNRPGESR